MFFATYYLYEQIKKGGMRKEGSVGEVMIHAYETLVLIPEGKRPLGRPRRRWENDIKTDLKEIGWGRL
jgi:hypothetical protein